MLKVAHRCKGPGFAIRRNYEILLENRDQICIGVIKGSRGIKGEVIIKSFTEEPENIAAYGPVFDENGQLFSIDVRSRKKGHIVARLSGITNKNSSEALRGKKLFISKSVLPKKGKNEFFCFDLLGLSVKTVEGRELGVVKRVLNFGAGDILETSDKSMIPFTLKMVPVVNLKRKEIIVEKIPELLGNRK